MARTKSLGARRHYFKNGKQINTMENQVKGLVISGEIPLSQTPSYWKALHPDMQGAKPAKENENKPHKPKVAPKHPGFNAMVMEAITHLKERTGSSLAAIKKVVSQKHGPDLPSNWAKQVTMAIRRLVQDNKLIQVKGSFKLGQQLLKPTGSKNGHHAEL